MSPERLLSVNEAAKERLNVSRWTVYREIEEGRLKAIRVRSRLRIRESEILRYLRDREKAA